MTPETDSTPGAAVPAGETDPGDQRAAEDEVLARLARSAAARTGGPAAAVRDELGRTYVAGAVRLAALTLSALQAAVAQAVASGATRLESVVLVGEAAADADPALLAEVGDPRVQTR